jgi:hypothetical protein
MIDPFDAATALGLIREGLAPQSVGKHRPGRTAMLMQHCHGAPGIVNTMADFPSPAIDDLLTAACETIWRAGPFEKR